MTEIIERNEHKEQRQAKRLTCFGNVGPSFRRDPMNRLRRNFLILFAGGVVVCLLATPTWIFAANLVLRYSADDVLGNGGLVKPADNDPVPIWRDLAGANNATI